MKNSLKNEVCLIFDWKLFYLMAICVSKIKVLLFRWIGLFVCPLSGQIQLFRIEKYRYNYLELRNTAILLLCSYTLRVCVTTITDTNKFAQWVAKPKCGVSRSERGRGTKCRVL